MLCLALRILAARWLARQSCPFASEADRELMWNRHTANVTQAAILLLAFMVASRDVDRTMRQEPVRPEQNRMLAEYLESRRK